MEGFERELDLDNWNDFLKDPPVSACELLDLDGSSSRIASETLGPYDGMDCTITNYDTSSLTCMNSTFGGAKAEKGEVTRNLRLQRIRQQRYRQKKRELDKIKAEKLEHARNSLRKIEEENKKIEQENRAMSCLIETASSMLQRMNLAALSSISFAPHRQILLILEGLAACRTFEHLTDEWMKNFFETFGAHAIIRTAYLHLSKSQFAKVVYIPILRTCKLVMEVGEDAYLEPSKATACIH